MQPIKFPTKYPKNVCVENIIKLMGDELLNEVSESSLQIHYNEFMQGIRNSISNNRWNIKGIKFPLVGSKEEGLWKDHCHEMDEFFKTTYLKNNVTEINWDMMYSVSIEALISFFTEGEMK